MAKYGIKTPIGWMQSFSEYVTEMGKQSRIEFKSKEEAQAFINSMGELREGYSIEEIKD